MEEDVAKDIQGELEQRLVAETNRLETRMQEDLELAVARKREELRASVLKALEADYVGRLAERGEGSRLAERRNREGRGQARQGRLVGHEGRGGG